MIVGVPKEIKNNEYRVSVTPSGVKEFLKRGHQVNVEYGAGTGSGFTDEEYEAAGAKLASGNEVYEKSEMIIKVKEILPPEYRYMRSGLIVFTYLHSNSNLEMTKVLIERETIGISYEDIENEEGKFPLLKPMSEMAGKGGFLAALNLTQSINGGSGILLARATGIETPVVTIIGAGAAGMGAAKLAASFENHVIILDISLEQLERAREQLPSNVELLYSDRQNLEKVIKQSDVIINCLMWNKTRKDHLVYREDLRLMKPNAIIIDVSCDEHGAIETSRATSHDNPIYFEEGHMHYAVDNIPSAFARTSTCLLTNVTLPYALEIASKGAEKAMKENPLLRKGLSFYHGKLTLQETAIKHQLPYVTSEDVLGIPSGKNNSDVQNI